MDEKLNGKYANTQNTNFNSTYFGDKLVDETDNINKSK
jgi:hypothetical protein